MDRLDIELYIERLTRYAARAADELADARLRQAWCELERDARPSLSPADTERLEAIGLLVSPASVVTTACCVVERGDDLAAIHRLQIVVERIRTEARQLAAGATATRRPPSPS